MLKDGMRLKQGQIWKKGEDYFRIVVWERLAIQYKLLNDPVSGEGTMHYTTKKDFCRLIKGAELLTPELPKMVPVNPPEEEIREPGRLD